MGYGNELGDLEFRKAMLRKLYHAIEDIEEENISNIKELRQIYINQILTKLPNNAIYFSEIKINDLKEDELAFHNPLHRQMLSEAAAHMHDSNFIAERYFLAHPDPVISKLSVDLINVRYQLSKYHSKSQKIVTDEERLYEMVPMLMINFKYAIVTEELKHMLYALQDPALAHDNEKCDSLMKRFNELKTVQSIMAKRLGDRVVLR